MTGFPVEQTSFAGGVMAPFLRGRRDVARYRVSLKTARNYIVLREGAATRTPGTRFVDALKDEAQTGRLLSYRFSTTDNYMLVFNGGVMRVIIGGGWLKTAPDGPPYELAIPYDEDSLSALRHVQREGEVYMVDGRRMPQVLRRIDHTNWTIADYAPRNGPVDTQNLDEAKTIQASAATGQGITLTASVDTFEAGHVGSTWRLDESDLSLVPQWVAHEAINLGDLRRFDGRVYRSTSANGTETGPNAPTHEEGDWSSGQGKVTWRFVHAGHGFVTITAVASATSATANVNSTLPDSAVSQATYRWWPPAWSDVAGWPDRIALYDEGLIFTRRDRFWITKAGTVDDFTLGDEDDSAIFGRLRSSTGSLVWIEWVLAEGVIIFGARDREYLVRAPTAYDPITPTNIRRIPQTSHGSASVAPVVTDDGVVYVGRTGERVHYSRFDALSDRLSGQDISLFGRHLLTGGVRRTAWQRDPHRVLWCLVAGSLVAVTLDLEQSGQEVIGWTEQPMAGAHVEDIASTLATDERETEVYMIVRRTIAGQERRYIEQLQPFFRPTDPAAPTAENAWFVHSGLEYTGVAAATLAGLHHLEEQEVAIVAEGRELPRQVVSSGQIQLGESFAPVLVGIPQWAEIEGLTQEVDMRDGSTLGRYRDCSHIVLDRLNSVGGEISINGGPAEQISLLGDVDPDAPIPLDTGKVVVDIGMEPSPECEWRIVNDNAMPTTLRGIAPVLGFGDR